jgi:hypothetical protein
LRSGFALLALRSGFALLALRSGFALLALRSGFALLALRSRLALRSGFALLALRADRSAAATRTAATFDRGAIESPQPLGVLEERARVAVCGGRRKPGQALIRLERGSGAGHRAQYQQIGSLSRGNISYLDRGVGEHNRWLIAKPGGFEIMAGGAQRNVERADSRRDRHHDVCVDPDHRAARRDPDAATELNVAAGNDQPQAGNRAQTDCDAKVGDRHRRCLLQMFEV